MENQFSFIQVFFLILVCLLAQKIWARSSKLPPGPWKLPIIGNIHQLVGSHPHRRLRDLANKYGPVMHLQLGQVSNIIISSPEAAKAVMKTHDLIFAQRPLLLAANAIMYNCSGIVFTPYGDYWRQMRKICILELLSAKRVLSFKSIREEEVSDLIRSISSSAGPTINLSKMLFSLSTSITIRAIFGKLQKGQLETFVPLVEEIMHALEGLSISDLFPSFKMLHAITGMSSKLKKLHQKTDEMLENFVNEHKEKRQATAKIGSRDEEDDLADVLLKLQAQEDSEFSFTNDNIKAIILDMFIGGSETSATLVEWTMSELIRNPRVMEKVQEEVRQFFKEKGSIDETSLHSLNYFSSVMKESLRLHPPGPLVPREAKERMEINGYEIPEKSHVTVNLWAIGRDPRHWTEAEKFYPERFLDSSVDYKGANFEFIPFGSGRRICPGMLFGMTAAEFLLANLLYHFDWRLPCASEPENLDMTENFGIATRRKNHLCLIPTLYHS